MATVALVIYTSAWPGIHTPIEIRVYTQAAPNAVIASLRYDQPHGNHTWSFPGLERTNLLFRTFQMADMVTNVIIQQLGDDEYVIPSTTGNLQYKNAVVVQADFTAGFASGVNTATFTDWIGFDIAIIDRLGTGPMKEGIDYSWNKNTGLLTLLQAGDLFGVGEYFQVQFAANVIDVPDSVASLRIFSSAKLVTTDYIVNAGADFGGILIVDPDDNYLEITLPDITTVPESKLINIEMRRSAVDKCAKIKTTAPDFIDWSDGDRADMYMCPQESISFYSFIDVTDPMTPVYMWRVFNPFGHFLTAGEIRTDERTAARVFNKKLLAGATGDVLANARIYNDVVVNLAAGETVNFDDWATGRNQLKWGLANSAIPGNAGKFKFPNRTGIVQKNVSGLQVSGDFSAGSVGSHRHLTVVNRWQQGTGALPFNRGAEITKLRAILKAWSNGGATAEGYYLDSDPAEPTLGRTSNVVDINSNSYPDVGNTIDTVAVKKYVLL
jgi:hypothetical protein